MEKPLTLPKGHSAKAEIIFNEDVDPIQVGFKEETGAYTAVAGQKTDAYTHVFSLPGAEGTYQVSIATSYPQPVIKFVAKFQLVVGSGQYQPLPKVPAGLLAMENVEDYSRFYTYLVRDDLPHAFELEIAQLKEFGDMRLVPKEQITDPQPLPITHPFTVWAQYNGQQESLYVSEEGIVYEDTLYYPSNLAALEAFLQRDQDGVTYRV